MKHDTTLSGVMRWIIPGAGLVQGLVLCLLVRYSDLFSEPAAHGWLFFLLVSSLSISLSLGLAATTLRSRVLWITIALVVLVTGAHSAWLHGNITGLDSWQQKDGIFNYFMMFSAMLFLSLPWLQSRLAQGHWRDFPSVFTFYWQNGVSVLFTLLVTGLGWAVLWLCSSLFMLIGIHFFDDLFFNETGAGNIVTCGIVAMSVLLCRSYSRLMLAVQHLLTLLATGLLPVIAVIMVLFMLALPGVGLNAISQQVSGAGLLNTLCLLFMLLLTLVWYPGRTTPPYPEIICRSILAALFLAPVCAAIAAWAIWVRVDQYGWTPGRLFATQVTLISLIWSIGYVITLLRRRNAILDARRTNTLVLLGTLLMLILAHTPVLDPWRIGVNSQMARFNADKATMDRDTIRMLGNSRSHGQEALKQLSADAYIQGKSALRSEVKSRLAGGRYEDTQPTQDEVKQRIPLAAAEPQPEQAFWDAMAKRYPWHARGCEQAGEGELGCLLMAKDLNGDGQPEWILFAFSGRNAFVISKVNGEWTSVGSFSRLPESLNPAKLKQLAQSPRLSTVPPLWRDLSVDGERLTFSPDRY